MWRTPPKFRSITMEDEKTPDQPEEPDTPDEPEKPDEPTPDVPQTGGSRAVIWVTGLLILACWDCVSLFLCCDTSINNEDNCGGPLERGLLF